MFAADKQAVFLAKKGGKMLYVVWVATVLALLREVNYYRKRYKDVYNLWKAEQAKRRVCERERRG